jgi:hypothetical protein
MITSILADNEHFHSTWQIDNAITAKSGGTLYGCYRQACRETHKRWRGLRDGYYQRRIAALDLADLEQQEPTERRSLDIQRQRLELIEGEQVLRDSEREFLRFAGQALACRRALGLNDEQTMPREMRERLDGEFWEYQLRCLAAVDFITTGRLSRNVVELLVSVSGEMRQRLRAAILDTDAHDKLVGWYLSHEPEMPQPLALTMPARELIECGSERLLLQLGSGIPADAPCNHAGNTASA